MAPSRMKLRVRRQDNTSSANPLPQSDDEEEEQQQQQQRRRQDRRRGTSTRSRSRRKNNNNNNNRTNNNNNTTDTSNNTSTTSASVPPAAAPPPSSSTATSRQVVSAEDTSPDSKCPICLDRFNNLAYLDRCLHRFCFMCIQEWSHNKAECPLCKQPFASILHTVRGENDFKKYTLRRSPENGSVAATVAMVAAMASDHRMRLTLRSTSNRQRRNQRMVPVWEWLVDSPPDSPEYIPISPVTNAEETQPFDLAERGIIFEGLTGLGSAGNLPPFVANNRETRKLLFRLAARRRLQREGGRVRPLRDRETIALRRGLYRCGIRVRGIAGSTQDQPQREISVESFCHNPSSLNRLRPWIRRELAVLYGSHDSLITIVQRIIMARIARHGLEDLPVVEDELRPFLLARTDHFLHELVSFARSPLTMENYDAQAVYEPPDVAFNVDALDSSTDSSAVIAISEEEEERERGGAVEPVQESQASLSMSGWDDETPGPSYSTADSSCYLSSFSPALHEAANRDRAEALAQTPASPRQRGEDEGEEECLIVGYKKPIAERTPELVQLSSDSEDEKKKKEEEEGEDGGGDGEKDEKEKGGKEEDEEATAKQPEPFFPALSPSPCREEIVDDAQPSRSHSDSPNPGQSLTEVLLRVLAGDCCESKRKKREKRRNKRLRSGGGGDTPQNLNSSPISSPCGHFSRSPSHESSFDSDFRGYSIVSPLNSSCPSTPKSSSSSFFGSSPSITPSPREKIQNIEEDDAAAAVAEKPGGKRKYKSRHLDSHIRDPTWKPSGGKGSACKSKSKAKEVERIRKEEREKRRRRRRRERRRRAREESRGRDERSPSVEIVFEGTVSSSAVKRRRQRDCLLSSPPLVITLDSDSDRGPLLDCSSSSVCSSPFGSQQTVNFCHFPALPLVVGGTLEGRDLGELPVDILDRESEKSDVENRRHKSAALISLENSSDSNTDIDVERVEANKTPNCQAEEMKEEPQRLKLSEDKAASSKSGNDFQERSEIPSKSSADDADQKLLDSILSVLDGIAAKPDLPSTSSPGFPQSNHFKNNTWSDKPKNHGVDRFPSPFYQTMLPPFQQLTENRTKFPSNAFPSAEKSHGAAKRTEEIANEFRTMHNLETRHEIANSLLALRDPENSLTTNDSIQNPALSSQSNRISSEISSSRSSPNSDSLLANLNEKTQTDLVHEKVCSDSRGDFDIRNYNSTNAEDVK